MRTIQQIWDGFERAVLPPNCSDVQRNEMRKAFYGGAGAMLAMTSEIAGIENREAAVAVLQGLHEEVAVFAANVT
jgi:hypothetical protein